MEATRKLLSSTIVALAVLVGCGSSKTPGGVGAVCDDGSPCAAGLSCFSGSAPQLPQKVDGLCSKSCTATATSDSCTSATEPNAACYYGMCEHQCGDKLPCPAGTTCNSDYLICVHD